MSAKVLLDLYFLGAVPSHAGFKRLQLAADVWAIEEARNLRSRV
jgi:hypothetical protein